MQNIKDYWYIATQIIMPIATYLLGLYISNKKVKTALCCIQRSDLLKTCEHYKTQGWCSIEAKDTLCELYNSYHDLGGNSFVTDMKNDVMKLPDKPKKRKRGDNE